MTASASGRGRHASGRGRHAIGRGRGTEPRRRVSGRGRRAHGVTGMQLVGRNGTGCPRARTKVLPLVDLLFDFMCLMNSSVLTICG